VTSELGVSSISERGPEWQQILRRRPVEALAKIISHNRLLCPAGGRPVDEKA
jgi:hypothetical protein